MSNFNELKEIVCRQNKRLKKEGLVILTWGNVSQITPDRKYVAIKPSGVPYDKLSPADIIVVDINGNVVEGSLKPSVDTLIHLEIYKKFPGISGVCHTHSSYATVFAQAKKTIPCYGTTHADYFNGPIPVTRELNGLEIETEYEKNLAKTIAEILNPEIPAVLAAGHGPFAFGSSADEAVENMSVLEEVAKTALFTGSVYSEQGAVPQVAMTAVFTSSSRLLNENLLKKHYHRKHGPGKYYGQN